MRLFLAAALVTLIFMAGAAWGEAQMPPQLGTVVSGSDIGFKIERQNGGTPIGRLVIKVNGRWVEPQFSMAARPLTK